MHSESSVLEVAILDVRPGQRSAFEAAFQKAQRFIEAVPGYQRHSLRHCLEQEDRYLLLVWWDSLESHTRGFRESEGYREWSALLHPFYEPFPAVEHYERVEGIGGAQSGDAAGRIGTDAADLL